MMGKLTNTDDKRQWPRVAVDTEVQVSFDDFATFKTQYAENISSGGMYLRVNEPVPTNKTIRFRLRIRDINQEIAGRAIVVWTKELIPAKGPAVSGLGLKFIELYNNSETFIEEFVAKHVEA